MKRVDGATLHLQGEAFSYLTVSSGEDAGGSSQGSFAATKLSPTECEVAGYVCQGYSNKQIATQRRVSVHTVGNQLASIYRKLGVANRHELVAWLSQCELPYQGTVPDGL